LSEDFPGEFVPTAVPSIHTVDDSTNIRLDELQQHPGQVLGGRRRATLIAHDFQRFSQAGDSQHGFDKIAALAADAESAVETASANNNIVLVCRQRREFAAELTLAVDA
jgi:hypothetical protein